MKLRRPKTCKAMKSVAKIAKPLPLCDEERGNGNLFDFASRYTKKSEFVKGEIYCMVSVNRFVNVQDLTMAGYVELATVTSRLRMG
jgi:hypothetical protein